MNAQYELRNLAFDGITQTEAKASDRSLLGEDKMQIMFATVGKTVRQLLLPPPDDEVLPGIRWGRYDELFTPAYWCGQAWQHEYLGTYKNSRLGRTLAEEVAACLLGGYGMRAEVGLAAFRCVRDSGLLEGTPQAKDIEKILTKPMQVGEKCQNYRFPHQKSSYLSATLHALATFKEPKGDIALRNGLVSLPGIGPKTASWIVRNYRSSDEVAIIDVHIMRAGRLLRIFGHEQDPSRDYAAIENAFLRFAAAIGTRASILDGLMWHYVRTLSWCID